MPSFKRVSRFVLCFVFFAWTPAFAVAMPVQYSMTPKSGLAITASCSDANDVETRSEIRIRFSGSRLEPVRTVGLTIGAKICVRFMGLVEQVIDLKAFPVVLVLTTPVGQQRAVALSAGDLAILQKQTGVALKPTLLVRHERSEDSRSVYEMSLADLRGEVAGTLSLEMSADEARLLPGYDFQTQLPIVAFSATFNGMSLSSSTRATATVGLGRAPIAAPAEPRRCTLWERFTSYFRGPNTDCR